MGCICLVGILSTSLAIKCTHMQGAMPTKIVGQYAKDSLTCCEIKIAKSKEVEVHNIFKSKNAGSQSVFVNVFSHKMFCC